MAEKSPKNDREQLESSLFTEQPALTAQQRRQEAAAAKAAARAAKKEERRQLRSAMREQLAPSPESRRLTIILTVLTVLVAAFAVAVLAFRIGTVGGREAKEGAGYYLNTGDLPEMGDGGIAASINEIYYTQNGGMQVRFTFINAEETSQHPTRIQVKIMNDENEVIAAASTTRINKDYNVAYNGGYNTYDLFIPRKYVQIPDDPLDSIEYEVVVDSEEYILPTNS